MGSTLQAQVDATDTDTAHVLICAWPSTGVSLTPFSDKLHPSQLCPGTTFTFINQMQTVVKSHLSTQRQRTGTPFLVNYFSHKVFFVVVFRILFTCSSLQCIKLSLCSTCT